MPHEPLLSKGNEATHDEKFPVVEANATPPNASTIEHVNQALRHSGDSRHSTTYNEPAGDLCERSEPQETEEKKEPSYATLPTHLALNAYLCWCYNENAASNRAHSAQGNSREYAHRRLASARPDLFDRVKKGELSANAK